MMAQCNLSEERDLRDGQCARTDASRSKREYGTIFFYGVKIQPLGKQNLARKALINHHHRC